MGGPGESYNGAVADRRRKLNSSNSSCALLRHYPAPRLRGEGALSADAASRA